MVSGVRNEETTHLQFTIQVKAISYSVCTNMVQCIYLFYVDKQKVTQESMVNRFGMTLTIFFAVFMMSLASTDTRLCLKACYVCVFTMCAYVLCNLP